MALPQEKDVERVSQIEHEKRSNTPTKPQEPAYNEELLEPPKEESLHRGLKARQVSMIALGGAVGTGLIIGSGTALQRGGPLGIFLGYSFVGFICYLVMAALGEMAAFLPHKKGFAGYATRFVDPAMGFAMGWNYLLKYLIVTPNNINAAGVVIQYWTRSVHIAVWMVILIVFIFVVNLLGVRVFGELEFWFSSIKVIALIGLLLMGIIIDLGGNPKHDRIGFRYWNPPYGPMGSYLLSQVKDESVSTFLGFWSTLTNALFAYIGTELIGVTVGEAENPRHNIPKAIRQTFFRILVFYVGGVFVIGLVVPSTDQSLFSATKSKAGAAASPFVVATTLVGIKTLNHVINAAILLFVMSAANSDLYIGSRTLYGLAVEGKAPRIFRRVNRMGVPYPSLILCTAFCGLVFLNTASSGAKVFTWFVALVSTFGALTWMCIAFSHIRFMRALAAQGIPRSSLPYVAPFQPWGSWFALIATGIITIFKGFDTFIPWTVDTFVTSYVGIPIFGVLYIAYKYARKTRMWAPEEVDLVTGIREIEEEEEKYKEEARVKKALLEQDGPRPWWKRAWDSI
ncbi:amino acid transporter [Marasmius tenuissimus]|uniref:Amino acid transporter n=1 Tax=Marasmius tenuissimus TaxID=585030 RepID=A0ABR2ZVF1_9AGAR